MQLDNFDVYGGGVGHDHSGHADHDMRVMKITMIIASNSDNDDDDASFTIKSICVMCSTHCVPLTWRVLLTYKGIPLGWLGSPIACKRK